MSVLTLVRHGQASFFADDYDRLSELGVDQARRLGDFWTETGVVLDAVYTGPRLRQKQTAELVGVAYQRGGHSWPEPVVLRELDEYDLGGVIQRLAPALADRDERFAELRQRVRQDQDQDLDQRARAFQKMFEVLMLHWQEATADSNEIEGWPSFRDRVERGVRRMIASPGRGRRVAAFTSGGFIGTAVQSVLRAPDRVALELSWRLRNGALTDFVFSSDRMTLDTFNVLPHLTDPGLWTYR